MRLESNISKFYQKTREERLNLLNERKFLTTEATQYLLENHLLNEDIATHLIENQIGQYPLPYGVALNFIVDEKEIIVPMVTEEPSVVAACSNAARFTRKTGGFFTTFDERLQTGQIIFYDVANFEQTKLFLETKKADMLKISDNIHPSIVARGGGVKDIEIKIINDEKDLPAYLTIYLYVDVQEAMGANIVNTILEGLTPIVQEWIDGAKLMSILSNYNDRALVTSTCNVLVEDLATSNFSGLEIAQKIEKAANYALLDPYRAATHNKGIMNGIDAVILATGNDYRAVEAGAHAYASKNGSYQAMSKWQLNHDKTQLIGTLTLPMLVGSLGGAISTLPLAKLSQELLKTNSAKEIARITVSVGLAQNFAALKALVTEGIQKGHMGLHANALAIHAGATDTEIQLIAEQLRSAPKMNLALAKELLNKLRQP